MTLDKDKILKDVERLGVVPVATVAKLAFGGVYRAVKGETSPTWRTLTKLSEAIKIIDAQKKAEE